MQRGSAYSLFSSSLCRENSCLTVQGLVHTVGSSIVTSYARVIGPVRVHRSTRCKFSRDPKASVFGLKLVTSTTSVSPSQWPRESPYHWRMLGGKWGLPFMTMLRCHPCPCPTS